MSLIVSNVSNKIKSTNDKKLEQFFKLGIDKSLLPNCDIHVLEFTLKNTYSAFANGIRRALIEELPVKCLTFNENEFDTTDQFILLDVIQKNINLIPINQDLKTIDITIKLDKYNDTDGIIDVKAGDIEFADSKNIINIPNIIIAKLRPGKRIIINKIHIIEGSCKTSASKFSLLSNVKYEILDHEPYDVFEKTGVRSTEYDPKEFKLSFTTAGNIKPSTVILTLCDNLIARLEKMLSNLITYIESKDKNDKDSYFSLGLEILYENNIKNYRFNGEYITLAYMVGQRCFLLDNNVKFCTPSIHRYDSHEVAIIKLSHADDDKLLMKSIKACIDDVKILNKIL